VKQFNEIIWRNERENIEFKGNVLKFQQNDDLKKRLIHTSPKLLVEANPHDCIWGIGLSRFLISMYSILLNGKEKICWEKYLLK
jgi:ribA/ribD-fused uncharacterized protein